MHNREDFRVILFGNTGSGKSATGNSLLERQEFPSGHSFDTPTTACSVRTKTTNDYEIKIVDTPGPADSEMCGKQLKEVVRSLLLVKPGPHAFLFVVSLRTRFTEDDFFCYFVLKQLFGEDFARHVILVFTHGDILAEEDTTFDTLLETAPLQLVRILEDCRSRSAIINNMITDTEQVENLVKTIRELKKESGHFSSLLTGLDESQLEKELDSRMKQAWYAWEQETLKGKTIEELRRQADEIQSTINNLDEMKDRQQRLIQGLLEEENFETRRLEAVRRVKENMNSVTSGWASHTCVY